MRLSFTQFSMYGSLFLQDFIIKATANSTYNFSTNDAPLGEFTCNVRPCPHVLFTIDISGTINPKELLPVQEYMNDAVRNNNSSFSIITFASRPDMYVEFSYDKEFLHQKIMDLKPYKMGTPGAYTNIDSGLILSHKLIGEQKLSQKVITMLFSDFKANSGSNRQEAENRTIKWAEIVYRDSLKFYPVAVGNDINNNMLRRIAVDPSTPQYYADTLTQEHPKLCYSL